ncbi:NAD-dependent epimerase/dehydratase family protein [Dyadobacter sp. Leaf189]|uniref:NAD-dependent epimerase/dehydratase family protein n=1 Tax=Dyadobacter sp. Leaf189 TaxID=1736295 RepID=UPI0006F85E45|nr:NAD-dependent epimerase/dehydratase family protein [Dyadobacter sp. Leaf189]KQS26628.1 epimerase [Dyadobacter sp. Leaf189]
MDAKKVFITGITGYIGGSVAMKLKETGYHVTGLVRKPEDIDRLNALGLEGVLGNIHDEQLLRRCISGSDTVIHTAESADDSFAAGLLVDLLAGTGKTLVFTSGSAILGGKEKGEANDFRFTEDIPLQPQLEMASRVLVNQFIQRAATRGVRSIVIVPTMVYGKGTGLKKDSIQLPALIRFSKEKGHGVYFGKGANRWSNLHIEDLVDLYLLAMEKAKPGSIYFAENGSATIRELAVKISDVFQLGEAQSVSVEEGTKQFGAIGAHFGFASSSYCSADKARKELGWKPEFANIMDFTN